MTLRVLPPGGGDGEGPGPSPSEIQAALAEAVFELAERMPTAERRFVETFAETNDTKDAVLAAFPTMLPTDESKLAARAMAMFGKPLVQEYLKLRTGIGAIGHGLNYGVVLQQMHILASDPDTPPYVKAGLLVGLAKELRESGVAAMQGLAVADPKQLGKGDDREPGALSDEDVQELEGILFGEEVG